MYDQNFDEINDCLKNKNFEICNKKLKKHYAVFIQI